MSLRADEMCVPYDAARPETLTAVGNVTHTFQPGRANVLAGYVLGILMIIGGLYLVRFPLRAVQVQAIQDRIGAFVFVIVFGLLPVGGLAMLVWINRLGSRRVLFGSKGVACAHRHHADICLWEHAAEIREVFTHYSIPLLKFPGAAIRRVAYRLAVQRTDGKTLWFTPDSVRNLPELARRLREVSDRNGIPWRREEIN
jgi:hypothetical protein